MNREVLKNFLKADAFKELDNIETDQEKELPQPAVQKSCPASVPLIDLIPIKDIDLGETGILEVLKHRKTRRVFSNEPLSLEELSFLLWSVQGVKKIVNKGYATLRTVPSAGARHSLETYIAVLKVKGLKSGIYRYLPLEHKLVFLFPVEDLQGKLNDAVFNQRFVGKSAVTFIWTTIPYRMEWRYDVASAKLIALDAGHVCENLYLSAECINAGVCAVAAYDQEKIDELINVDGNEEFTIYLAAVGRSE
ncbi:SagB/ThcOx family dehydrogenase [Clostridium sp. P21]|uniref:SagB/ThcOx family dehydrogenase n=1 Tax=Clostridium muellerianum TaxID=2716538 RepID=A0A7Y0ED04_9CLOT|nr:SagB/ThcOx family dehydrogenase [Clostridium muellerianum]NMM61249.1 SagB/ThcOx family dehydrogenase [Clostridium muellerianum]